MRLCNNSKYLGFNDRMNGIIVKNAYIFLLRNMMLTNVCFEKVRTYKEPSG